MGPKWMPKSVRGTVGSTKIYVGTTIVILTHLHMTFYIIVHLNDTFTSIVNNGYVL